jgi:hypothetical protein
MAEKRMELIGLIALALTATATVAFAQSAPVTLLVTSELAVSPALPSGLLSGESSGSNPLAGLPCTGGGASAVSDVGGLGDTTTPLRVTSRGSSSSHRSSAFWDREAAH